MFENFEKNKIIVKDSKENLNTYIFNIFTIPVIEDLFKEIEWLFTEAVNDYHNTFKRIEGNRQVTGGSHKNPQEVDDYRIRLGSITRGYINTLCLIEDILVYEYDRMSDLIEKSLKGINLGRSDYKHLMVMFKDIRFYRDKVTAHTAYTYPYTNKKNPDKLDNPVTRVSSMLNLFPDDCGIDLGRVNFCYSPDHESQLPIISIFEWEEKIKPIFVDWENLFVNKFKLINKNRSNLNSPYSMDVLGLR